MTKHTSHHQLPPVPVDVDTEDDHDWAVLDGHLIEEADSEHPHGGKATRVTAPSGAVWVFAHGTGEVLRTEGVGVLPRHVEALVLYVARYGTEEA